MSPVVSDAAMISVESISPTMISTVCALRRGMLRIAILKMTRLRSAIEPRRQQAHAHDRQRHDQDRVHREAEDVVHVVAPVAVSRSVIQSISLLIGVLESFSRR